MGGGIRGSGGPDGEAESGGLDVSVPMNIEDRG
jgi:hypothetical protein